VTPCVISCFTIPLLPEALPEILESKIGAETGIWSLAFFIVPRRGIIAIATVITVERDMTTTCDRLQRWLKS